jgi:hypothetical protein
MYVKIDRKSSLEICLIALHVRGQDAGQRNTQHPAIAVGPTLNHVPGCVCTAVPNLLDNKEVFLHACATVAFALRAVADAVRTRTEKLPYYRVHSV